MGHAERHKAGHLHPGVVPRGARRCSRRRPGCFLPALGLTCIGTCLGSQNLPYGSGGGAKRYTHGGVVIMSGCCREQIRDLGDLKSSSWGMQAGRAADAHLQSACSRQKTPLPSSASVGSFSTRRRRPLLRPASAALLEKFARGA